MTGLIAGAFLAGLVGSPHCIGMCGGFASVCARTLRGSVAWHAGRLSTYAALGALSGAAGALLRGPAWLPLVASALLLVWFAGVLAGVFPQLGVAVPGIARAGQTLIARTDVPSRYAFGLVTGLLPCGLVYAGLSFAIASASPVVGALSMIAFGVATVPALAFVTGILHRIMARGIWYRRGLAVLVLLAGLWSLGTRAVRIYGAEADGPPMHHVR